jgi:hypothetical protein
MGGIYQFPDGRDTSDNVNLILDYPEKLNVTFEASLTERVPFENTDIVFIGDGGTLHIFRYGYRFKPAGEKDVKAQITAPGTRDNHMGNWLDCVRSRKEPNATVEQGHYSAMACHIGNIACAARTRVGWKTAWNL